MITEIGAWGSAPFDGMLPFIINQYGVVVKRPKTAVLKTAKGEGCESLILRGFESPPLRQNVAVV